MADYITALARTASTTASCGTIGAGATPRRGAIYEIEFSSEGTPADNVFLWVIQRCTALGTSTAVTPSTRDQADTVAANAAAGQNHTIEPTYTANLVMNRLALNQRATYRWVAVPGKELVYPATQNNGFGWATPTATAVAISLTVSHTE